jgi:hypothetical protein
MASPETCLVLDATLRPCTRRVFSSETPDTCGGIEVARLDAPPLLIVWTDAAGARRLAAASATAADGDGSEPVTIDLLGWRRACSAVGAGLVLVVDRAPANLRAALVGLQARMLLEGEASLVHVASRADADEMVGKLAALAAAKPAAPSFLGSCSVFKPTGAPPASEALAIWLRMLIQLPGLSDDVAEAIADRFRSWAELMDFLEQPGGSTTEKQRTLAELQRPTRDGRPGKRVGPVLAKRVHDFFTASDADAAVR